MSVVLLPRVALWPAYLVTSFLLGVPTMLLSYDSLPVDLETRPKHPMISRSCEHQHDHLHNYLRPYHFIVGIAITFIPSPAVLTAQTIHGGIQ